MQLQDSKRYIDLIGIMDMWWDSLHDWNNAEIGYRFFGKDTPRW